MKFKVNPRLVPIKTHFFLNFAGLSPILPFLPVFAKQIGFDEVSVGIVFAILPFSGMLAKPIAGWIADRFGLEKIVFMVSILLSGVFYSALLLLGDIQADTTSTLQCSSPFSILKVCRGEEATMNLVNHQLSNSCPEHCELKCSISDESVMKTICEAAQNNFKGCYNDTTPLDLTDPVLTIFSNVTHHDTQPDPQCLLLPIDSIVIGDLHLDSMICSDKTEITCLTTCYSEHLKRYVRQDSVFSSPNFWFFTIFNIIAYSAFSVTTSMGDALCFNLLEGKHEEYGAQRVFGSIGWGLFTILGGYLIDSYSQHLNGAKDYSPALYLMAGLLVLDLICSWKMQIKPPVKSTSGGSDMMRLLSSPRVVLFVIWCTVVGIFTSLVWQWLPWYLADLADTRSEEESCLSTDHGATWLTLLLSLNMGIQCFVGEVPLFFLSGWILKTLGHIHTMTLVLGAFGLRLLFYSFLTNPWHSLPIEVLNGITFGIFYATMTSYAHIIAPPGMGSTMQGIVGGAFEGAGVAIGSLAGGAVYKMEGGGAFMFRCFGLFSLTCCLAHALLQILLRNLYPQLPDTDGLGLGVQFTEINSREDDPKPIFKGLRTDILLEEPEQNLI